MNTNQKQYNFTLNVNNNTLCGGTHSEMLTKVFSLKYKELKAEQFFDNLKQFQEFHDFACQWLAVANDTKSVSPVYTLTEAQLVTMVDFCTKVMFSKVYSQECKNYLHYMSETIANMFKN